MSCNSIYFYNTNLKTDVSLTKYLTYLYNAKQISFQLANVITRYRIVGEPFTYLVIALHRDLSKYKKVS